DGDSLTVTSPTAAKGTVSIVNNKISFDPGADFDYLSAGQTTDLVINYGISDGNDTVPGTLTITITGQDDTANITGNISGSLTENSSSISTGDLNANDPDSSEDKFITQTNIAGTYGSFSIMKMATGLIQLIITSSPFSN
ncbi:MAG: VCBS domain-containing protein, partial [Emcibacteraceae bacterium]|nr:VCBS domain-containing protein [Emcibacteraceae bacterium]